MQSIISKLDPETSSTVRRFWQILYEKCGLTAIYSLPTPHVTWFAAESLELDRIPPILANIASRKTPFTLHTFGLGIFTGEQPVLYLPMVKSFEMIDLHGEIWDQIEPYSQDPKIYYSPRLWVPHITLALRDLSQETLSCAVEAIGFEPIELFVMIDNLIMAESEESSLGKLLCEFTFSGEIE
jgi:2'-5' RNA ligase